MADLSSQTARRSNSEFTGIGARASRRIDDGSGAGLRQTNPLKLSIEIWQIGFTDPAENNVLLDRRSYVFSLKRRAILAS